MSYAPPPPAPGAAPPPPVAAPGAAAVPDSAHPVAALFTVLFKALALAAYILCGWFPTGFVLNFCVVAFFLVCDFWTVKNVSGRLLVGLRWWNEVSDGEGGSDWRFESLEEGQREINPHDSRLFWTLLYASPPVWGILGLVALLKLNLDYFLLVLIAVLLSVAQLTGYLKCSRAAQNQLRGAASGLVASGIRAYLFGK